MSGAVAAGDRGGARRVEADGVAGTDLGEVGADRLEVVGGTTGSRCCSAMPSMRSVFW